MEEELNGTISLAMKINLGNYESAEAFISLSNITQFTTKEEIDRLLDGSMKIGYDSLKIHMCERINNIKRGIQ